MYCQLSPASTSKTANKPFQRTRSKQRASERERSAIKSESQEFASHRYSGPAIFCWSLSPFSAGEFGAAAFQIRVRSGRGSYPLLAGIVVLVFPHFGVSFGRRSSVAFGARALSCAATHDQTQYVDIALWTWSPYATWSFCLWLTVVRLTGPAAART